MSVDGAIQWDRRLCPAQIAIQLVPFSRSGGRTLGGIERSTRTDVGYWSIAYKGVALHGTALRRIWHAIAVEAGGTPGLLEVPAWSPDVNPWADGTVDGFWLSPHSDDSAHSDDSLYATPAILVELVTALEIGDTSARLRIVGGIDDLSGVRWSYQGALYQMGLASLADEVYTARIFPAVRAAIPAGAALEFSRPTCLVHLASDREMDAAYSASRFDLVDVAFVEAVDYWNDLATAAA